MAERTDAPAPAGYRIAADIGGTFTDIACLSPEGQLTTCKLPSSPDDYARAILDGIAMLAARLSLAPDRFSEVLHASTIATNAILEGKGAITALVTTEGFRDVLELRRIRVPRLYEPLYEKPAPLVPRRRRYEVTERMGPRGEVLTPLDLAQTRALAAQLAASDVEAVAVCFLHSYVNPDHERQVAAILRDALPGRFLSISHDVLPEMREYERTSTTVVNAYVGPVVSRYLTALQTRLAEAGIGGRLLMMQSSGGMLDVAQVIAKPATVIESGPAAGVVGAARMRSGHGDVITFDMGGTTAKASLIEGGRLVATDQYEVGGGISLSSALAKGGGYALKLPVIDVSEVGAGGGSIVRIDAGGALKVGPDSAGAMPGPACYGRGGEEPTVTDANVVLGYLNPQALAGGSVPIDGALSVRAIGSRLCEPLGRDLHVTAHGIHRLANATMMRAVKAVSTYRGRDPRDFALFAFGGNGGVHAATLAAELGMRTVIVPPGAGVFSAVGLLFADHEVLRTAPFAHPLDDSDALATAMAPRFAPLADAVRAELGDTAHLRIARRVDLRYAGQGFELTVDVPAGPITAATLAGLRGAFEAEHRRSYGHAIAAARIDVVALRVAGIVSPAGPPAIAAYASPAPTPPTVRRAYFGAEHGLVETPVIDRPALGRTPRAGPLIIEEYEGTTVIPPHASAVQDGHGNIVITLHD